MKELRRQLGKKIQTDGDGINGWLILIVLITILTFFVLWIILLWFGLMAMSGITDTSLTQLDGVIMTAAAIIIAKWS